MQAQPAVSGRSPQEPDSDAATSFEPLLGEVQTAGVQVGVQEEQRHGPKPPIEVREAREEARPSLVEPLEETVSENVHRKWAAENRQRASAHAPRAAPQPLHARPPAGMSREPDEIQIHIGRIEVTAVPPPPLRPAPKPANKPLDLRAYLKRRGGGQ
jgi:hypothetical protein